eukprot:669844-Heterocapsa_arctica.AAC.1
MLLLRLSVLASGGHEYRSKGVIADLHVKMYTELMYIQWAFISYNITHVRELCMYFCVNI